MRPHETAILFAIVAGTAFSSPAAFAGDAGDAGEAARPGLVFCCTAENDLYRVITAGGREYPRSDSAAEAVRAAAEGAGVLILADGYPGKATPIAPEVLEEASRKKLRLYIEYPSALPGLELGQPRQCPWERVVVASDAFGPELPRMRILMIHDCRMLPVEAARPHLVSAWVAGFDTAVYGLPGETWPLLFEHPQGQLLIATTKLSHFVTGRYSPSDAWHSVWRMIFGWLTPGAAAPELAWTPTVRPTYGRDEPLPKDAELSALKRGAEWFLKSRFLVHPAWKEKYARSQPDDFIDSDLVGPGPGPDWPIGDGSQGILEGHSSTIFLDGSQPIRWGLRGDCNTETAMALGLRSLIDGDPKYANIARNLADFVYFNSPLNGGPRADPKSPSYGLLSFYSSGGGLGTYFPNDNAKANLATMTTAAVLKTDRWDEPLLRTILANFRVTGALGFRTGGPYSETMLQEKGWRYFAAQRYITPWPQREGWAWAVYLWLYDKTRYEPLLERALAAISTTMERYPDGWRWAINQKQMERARMLLPLAWLLRVQDTPEHRRWFRQIADDLLAFQDASGGLREELADVLKSNEEYGRAEMTVMFQTGDPVADLIYVMHPALLGLHEGVAVTGDEELARAADRMAEFLVRAQVRSEAHPELDGAWYRAFDMRRWDYWGSNGDNGWGAWCTETGWTQSRTVAALALRQLDTTIWELTAESRIADHFEKYRRLMEIDEAVAIAAAVRGELAEHAARGKRVTLAQPPDHRYGGGGAADLTDGGLGNADNHSAQWIGFRGIDLEATVDLEQPVAIRRLEAHFLQNVGLGIYLPRQVEWSVSDDGRTFRTVAVVKHDVSLDRKPPLVHCFQAEAGNVTARYVRLDAANVGVIPLESPGAGRPAWMFTDEIIVK